MPRGLNAYGFEGTEFDGFVVEDPVLFDGMLARMVEDIEVAAYTVARDRDRGEIDAETVDRVRGLFGEPSLDRAPDLPPAVREGVRRLVRDIARAPLAYSDEAVERVADVVGAAGSDFLWTAAREAQREGSRRIKLRHYLPACEEWPYPLNRFC